MSYPDDDGASAETASDNPIRPYVMTGGRAHGRIDLPWETLIATTTQGRTATASFEYARILRLCGHPRSVAEVSAHLGLPIGVVRVLVADLLSAGLVEGAAPAPRDPATDVEFLERLMHGVVAL